MHSIFYQLQNDDDDDDDDDVKDDVDDNDVIDVDIYRNNNKIMGTNV